MMDSNKTNSVLLAKHIESLMYKAPAGFLMVDQEGIILFVNQLVEKMFNYQKEELIGRQVEILLPNRFHDQHTLHRKKFIKTPSSRKMGKGRNLFAKTKEGREFPVEVGLGYSRDQKGLIISAVIIDISKQREVESEREKLIAELKDALSKVKNLSGLLPICAGCKKIRDDTGYWNQIESYIHAHSEAEFSHGLCPQCAKDLYPDLDINNDDN